MRSIYTIGFTQKSAESFFDILMANKINLIVDVRLNNKGQLAGYTKERDFKYFLSLFEIGFSHLVDFAPTKQLRKEYHSDWDFSKYRREYLQLIRSRSAVDNLSKSVLTHERICLLCSEPEPDRCHRRLAAEEIVKQYKHIPIQHL